MQQLKMSERAPSVISVPMSALAASERSMSRCTSASVVGDNMRAGSVHAYTASIAGSVAASIADGVPVEQVPSVAPASERSQPASLPERPVVHLSVAEPASGLEGTEHGPSVHSIQPEQAVEPQEHELSHSPDGDAEDPFLYEVASSVPCSDQLHAIDDLPLPEAPPSTEVDSQSAVSISQHTAASLHTATPLVAASSVPVPAAEHTDSRVDLLLKELVDKNERITEMEDALVVNRQNDAIQKTRIKQLEDEVRRLLQEREAQPSPVQSTAQSPVQHASTPLRQASAGASPVAMPSMPKKVVLQEQAISMQNPQRRAFVSQTVQMASARPAQPALRQVARTKSSDSLVTNLKHQLAQAQEAIVASTGDPFEDAVQSAVEQVFDRVSPTRQRQTFAEQLAIAALSQHTHPRTQRPPSCVPVSYPLSPWRERHHSTTARQPSYYLPCTGMGL